MISLTRLNGDKFTFNALYIEQVESKPDTLITTIQGKKFVVKDPEEVVVGRIQDFYRTIGLIGTKAGEE